MLIVKKTQPVKEDIKMRIKTAMIELVMCQKFRMPPI